METLLSQAFYTLGAWGIETLVEFVDLYDRIRRRHATAWRNLTRPLKPTDEEAVLEAANAQQTALIAHLNQDVKQYNYKSWWKEYAQAKVQNGN